jgi:transposase InsO family protein
LRNKELSVPPHPKYNKGVCINFPESFEKSSHHQETQVSFQVEFDSLKLDVRILIKKWRKEYNQVRPHSSLGYRPPAPETIIPVTLT